MKVIVNMPVDVRPQEVSKYPYIGIANNRCIVLFTDPGEGVCLDIGKTTNRKGEFCRYWSEHDFERYIGEVVLSND